ncbi:hypothetical protein ACFX1T_007617 [Malus domestica]
MSLWKGRQMNRDGSIRNPADEKPLVVVEAPVVETAPKSNAKQVAEDTKNKSTAPKATDIDVADKEIFVSERETPKRKEN